MRDGILAHGLVQCLLLLLSACTALDIRQAAAPREIKAAPRLEPPFVTHRFQFDPNTENVVGEIQVIRAVAGDTLPEIARRFNFGYDEIRRANPTVDTWLPGVGTEIVLPTQFVLPDAPRRGIVINLAALRLFRFLPTADGGLEVITHPVGIGRVGWVTPTGITKVMRRVVGPSWYPPASIRAEHRAQGDILPAVVPPGPDNRLGTLAALVPTPRVNLTRYHGVFAPNHRLREQVTPAKRGRRKTKATGDPPPARHVSMTWAQRLQRVFKIDIETCAHCGGAVKVNASIEDPAAIKQILGHLERRAEPATPATRPFARAPPPTELPGLRELG